GLATGRDAADAVPAGARFVHELEPELLLVFSEVNVKDVERDGECFSGGVARSNLDHLLVGGRNVRSIRRDGDERDFDGGRFAGGDIAADPDLDRKVGCRVVSLEALCFNQIEFDNRRYAKDGDGIEKVATGAAFEGLESDCLLTG